MPLPDPTTPEYLGDGCYVKLHESGQVVLFTTDGISTTNSVFLEPEVLRSFKEWIGRHDL
jgi:hypothetical protein